MLSEFLAQLNETYDNAAMIQKERQAGRQEERNERQEIEKGREEKKKREFPPKFKANLEKYIHFLKCFVLSNDSTIIGCWLLS